MGGVTILYGPAIHEAIGKGDLEEMRALAQQAEEHIKEFGNVPAALESVRAEIAKVEQRGG
jgi:hypothetical protein